jgi:hypothetical protein
MEEQPRSLSEPVREKPLSHQCVCLLLHPGQPVEVTPGVIVSTPALRDKCYAVVDDPDSPFCSLCEQAGHPDLHTQAAERVVRRP